MENKTKRCPYCGEEITKHNILWYLAGYRKPPVNPHHETNGLKKSSNTKALTTATVIEKNSLLKIY